MMQPPKCIPKKVMLLVNSLRSGGTERNLVAYSQHMDRNLFSPEICTILPDGELYDAAMETGVPIHCHHRKERFNPRFALAFSRYLATAPVDLIHVFSHTSLLYAAMARSLWRCPTPIVYSEGTSVPTEGWRSLPFHWCLRQVDACAANSPASRDKLICEGVAPAKISLIPNGHDVHSFDSTLRLNRESLRETMGLTEEHFVILFSGRLLTSKRVCDLIDALPQLTIPRRLLRILIVGDGSEMLALKQQTARIGWTDEVKFLGYRHDVHQLLHIADVFAFPSEVEGLPNSVVEAALMQVPIVAADIAGTRAVVGQSAGAKLVPCRRADLLAVALSETLTNLPASRSAAKSLAVQAAQNFSLENALHRLYGLYQHALEIRR